MMLGRPRVMQRSNASRSVIQSMSAVFTQLDLPRLEQRLRRRSERRQPAVVRLDDERSAAAVAMRADPVGEAGRGTGEVALSAGPTVELLGRGDARGMFLVGLPRALAHVFGALERNAGFREALQRPCAAQVGIAPSGPRGNVVAAHG